MAVEHPLPPLRSRAAGDDPRPRTRARGDQVTRWRAVLWMTCLGAVGLAGTLAASAPAATTDADLARLLRAMGLIKAAMALAAAALVHWRLTWPVSDTLATGYVAGSALTVGAATMIVLLAHIPAAAAVFHVGGAILIVAGFRDGGLSAWPAKPGGPNHRDE